MPLEFGERDPVPPCGWAALTVRAEPRVDRRPERLRFGRCNPALWFVTAMPRKVRRLSFRLHTF